MRPSEQTPLPTEQAPVAEQDMAESQENENKNQTPISSSNKQASLATETHSVNDSRNSATNFDKVLP